jgi:hypothetical protein
MKLQCRILDPVQYSNFQEVRIYKYAQLHAIILHQHISVTRVTIFSVS